MPCACKKPHLALSERELKARVFLFSNSAQDVAMSAIRHGAFALKLELASCNAIERRNPRGSESNSVPSNSTVESDADSSSIESPERRSTPPSMDFNASCVNVGLALASRIDGAETEGERAYDCHRAFQS